MKIFISYGHDEHISFARSLAAALRERGDEVWFDEDQLKVGRPWEEYIERGLRWVAEVPEGKMILIMTPHSVRRPDGFCLNELAYALDLNLEVLPIMLVWTTPPLSIYRYQWLDLTDRTGESDFADDFRKIVSSMEKQELIQTGSHMFNLKNTLDPLDFTYDIKLYQPGFIGREWIMSDFEKWITCSPENKVYMLLGLPGVGKTALAVHLLQTCKNIMAFHLCRRGNSEKTSVRRAVCSIAYQLSRAIPEYKEQLLKINIVQEKDRCNDDALFEALLAAPLNACPQQTEHAIILIDALDEAGDLRQCQFASFLSRNIEKLPQWVRIAITSRPEDVVMMPLKRFKPHILNADSEENRMDIDRYVRERLTAIYGDSAPEGSAIVEQSEGIFLYARYVCDELTADKPEAVLKGNLPSGMGAIYYDFMSRHFDDIRIYRDRMRPLLQLICAQVEPLSIGRMAACSGMDMDSVYDFLSTFKSLVYAGGDDKIRPFHSSFTDWLTDRKEAGIYAVSLDSGNECFAKHLYELFKESGYNFFMEGEDAEFLVNWTPEILQKTKSIQLDARMLVHTYITETQSRYILIRNLITDRKRFHFIKSVFNYAFRNVDEMGSIFDEYPHNEHATGLRFMYEYIKTGHYTPPEVPHNNEYYYFLMIQMPLLYLSPAFDTDSIFRTLADGICSAGDDGRISTTINMLSEYHKLATESFKESASIAAGHLERVAATGVYMADQISNCATSIRRSMKDEIPRQPND